MAKYKNDLVEVEAFKFGVDYCPDWFMDRVTNNSIILHKMGKSYGPTEGFCEIRVPDEELVIGNLGDYIVMDSLGKVRPHSADIFENTYSKV